MNFEWFVLNYKMDRMIGPTENNSVGAYQYEKKS